MTLADRIAELVSAPLDAMGYALVRVHAQGRGQLTLQVMIERKDGAPVAVEDCTRASRSISALLDVEDPIAESYTLEVSSPGLDRPLVRAQDFVRFAGCEAALEAAPPFEGRKRFKGRLLGLDAEGRVRIALDEGECSIPLAQVARARLVPTQADIAAALRRPHA